MSDYLLLYASLCIAIITLKKSYVNDCNEKKHILRNKKIALFFAAKRKKKITAKY